MKQPPPGVLVLHEAIGSDARADELDTLAQAEQIAVALRKLGVRVSKLETGLDLGATLAVINERRPDCVFNLVESLGGDGRMVHFIPSVLQAAGVAFTGSGSDAMYLSSHKQLAKDWMRLKNIPTPPVFVREEATGDDRTRWIVKSVWEHASFGMDDGCVVNGRQASLRRLEESSVRYGGEWFAEQYISGREFNISVLERDGQPHILPVAEITFEGFPPGKPEIVGYAAKWDEEAPEFHATPRTFPVLSSGLLQALTQVVLRCWHGFGLSGYARVDVRVDVQENPWVLEVNANPCLSRDAGFAAAAEVAGISYEELVWQVVETGLQAGSGWLTDTDYSRFHGKG